MKRTSLYVIGCQEEIVAKRKEEHTAKQEDRSEKKSRVLVVV